MVDQSRRRVEESCTPHRAIFSGPPRDSQDLGRSYEAVIRVNSQSGKGGVAYLLKTDRKLDLPRKLQIEFSHVVQAKTDADGGEVTSDQIWEIFQDEYLPAPDADAKWGRFELLSTRTASDMTGTVTLNATLRDGEEIAATEATGNGPVAAFLSMMQSHGISIRLFDWVEVATLILVALTFAVTFTSSR